MAVIARPLSARGLIGRAVGALRTGAAFSPVDLFNAGANGRLSDSSVETDLMYVRRFDSVSIGVGRVQKNGKSSEFRLAADGDGYVGIQRGYAGESAFVSYIKPTLTGSFVTTSPNSYTTSVGATLTFSFTGTKLSLLHYSDDRGGLWNFSIDGGADIPVSVYSASTIASNESLVASGLDDTEHTVVATFAGADPENPPSATARGWFIYDYNDVGTIARSTFSVEGGATRALAHSTYVEVVPTTILELAFNQTPTGSGFAPDWFPDHGPDGSMRDGTATMTIDGVSYSAVPADFIGRINFSSSLVLEQSFTAYSPSDATKQYPLADVTVRHTFDRSGLSVFVDVDWISDAVSTGYVAMCAGKAANLPTILTNEGYKAAITVPGVQQDTDLDDTPSNIMFVNTTSGHGVAMQTDIAAATDAGDWTVPDPAAFYTERTDGASKAYLYAALNRAMTSSDRLSVTNRYAIVAGADFPAGFEVAP